LPKTITQQSAIWAVFLQQNNVSDKHFHMQVVKQIVFYPLRENTLRNLNILCTNDLWSRQSQKCMDSSTNILKCSPLCLPLVISSSICLLNKWKFDLQIFFLSLSFEDVIIKIFYSLLYKMNKRIKMTIYFSVYVWKTMNMDVKLSLESILLM
jgi:hypothetical protein